MRSFGIDAVDVSVASISPDDRFRNKQWGDSLVEYLDREGSFHRNG